MDAIVCDVDNTLTPPRRAVEPEMAALLAALSVPFHVAAGSDLALVEEQLIRPLHAFGYRGTFDAFVCNGSDRYRCVLAADCTVTPLRTFDLRAHFGEAAFDTAIGIIKQILADPEFALPSSVGTVGPRIQHRGSMINVAPIGRPASMNPEAYRHRDAFVAFDQQTRYRERMLARLECELREFRQRKQLRITLGGQTSFDLVVENNDKRYSVQTLLDEGLHEIAYLGDALHAGGNDAAVLELAARVEPPYRVTAIRVRDWQHALEWLRVNAVAAGSRRRATS